MFLRTATRSILRTPARPTVVLPLLRHSLPQLRSFSLSPPSYEAPPVKTPIGRIDRRLQITFTCTAVVPDPSSTLPAPAPGEEDQRDGIPCHHRSTHEFSKRSYEKGIVLVECPGCGNRHLIADNLQWFSSTPSPAHPEGLPIGGPTKRRTVEDLVKEKGEEVKWIDGGPQGGTWELEG